MCIRKVGINTLVSQPNFEKVKLKSFNQINVSLLVEEGFEVVNISHDDEKSGTVTSIQEKMAHGTNIMKYGGGESTL